MSEEDPKTSLSSYLHRRLIQKSIHDDSTGILSEREVDLAVVSEKTKDEDVLSRHYAAIYGEGSEEVMLEGGVGVMSDVGLSSKEREHFAMTLKVNMELERRVKEMELEIVQIEQKSREEQNRLRRDLMGDDLSRERLNWLDKFQDQNEMLQDIYDEMLRGRERLAMELANIKRERDELAQYKQLVQDWAASHAISLGVSPPQFSSNMESTATSLISGIDYSKILTNELALEQNVEALIRDLRQKHRMEREKVLKRHILERDRLASEVGCFESEYRKDPSNIDSLSEIYAQLLPRALQHDDGDDDDDDDDEKEQEEFVQKKAINGDVVEKLNATISALQSKIHKLEINAASKVDVVDSTPRKDSLSEDAEERICSLMLRVCQLEEENLAQGDRHAVELARMQTDITNKNRIIKSQRANLRRLALKIQQAGLVDSH